MAEYAGWRQAAAAQVLAHAKRAEAAQRVRVVRVLLLLQAARAHCLRRTATPQLRGG